MHRRLTLRFAVLLIAGLTLALGGCRGSSNPIAVTPVAAGAPSIPLDPAVRTGVLDNGLTWYVRVNSEPQQRAELRLVIDAGSLQEDDDQLGLAHFVEHMAFNGTRHFEKQQIIDFFEGIGMRFGADLNAYTSFDETVYSITVPTDDRETVGQALLVLEDWAHGVSFEDEEIEKERGVVLEEWRSGRGAAARIRDEQFPILFRGSRYAERLPIGDPEVIRSFEPEVLRRYYRDWYRPELMSIVAVGDFDGDWMETEIRERFGGIPRRDSPRERVEWPVPAHEETLFAIATDPEVTTTQVGVYYKLDKTRVVDLPSLRESMVEQLYHALINSRLAEIRQQPSPPFLYAFSGAGAFTRARNVVSQMAGVEEGGVDRGLEALLLEIERVDRFGFQQSELDRVRENYLRGIEQALRERDKQKSVGFAAQLVQLFLVDAPAPALDWYVAQAQEMLPGIQLEEVNRRASSWITEHDRVITYTGPADESSATITEEELLAIFARAESAEIAPWVDRTREGPLVADRPAGGHVVERGFVEELGASWVRMSNGALVVMKPTEFKNDEILLQGFSPGGNSQFTDEDLVSGMYATSALGAGGLGSFDLIELQKALTGKVARVSPSIAAYEESIGGRASPEDLETMFQLVWLWFTEPRADHAAFTSWIERSVAAVENRMDDPQAQFFERWNRELYGDHPRLRLVDVETLRAIDLDRARELYLERFSDAGDFTFVIVGNFDPLQIEGDLATWIGGLPATGRQESPRDVGPYPLDRTHEFTLASGLEPKGLVRLQFHGPADASLENRQALAALVDVLRIRLREVLREDMGGTYGVSVSGTIARRPREYANATIAFGCAPEKIDELIASTLEEIESIQRDGISDDVLDKVKESQLRSFELTVRENSYWLSVLTSVWRYGTDPGIPARYPERVRAVTGERVGRAARELLGRERYLYGRLVPGSDEE